jgi:serine protease Do
VVVVGIQAGSKGDQAGVRVGDVVKEINHQTVKNVGDYKSIIDEIQSGETINMFILRRNAGFIVVKLTK